MTGAFAKARTSAGRDRSISPAGPPKRVEIIGWLMTAGLCGLVIMTLELAAFRLYAPYFGYSIYVWGSMIGVIMVALAGGYALGGWAADRFGGDSILYGAILVSAFYQIAMVLSGASLLAGLVDLGEIAGPLIATFILFLPPMLLLAAAGPYLIRLIARMDHVGGAAGSVYAVSTVGSLVGVFGTSFFSVPTLGTRITLEIACGLTAGTGIAGLAVRKRKAVLLAIPMALVCLARTPRQAETIWSAESAYNFVRVARHDRVTMLVLNQDLGVHTFHRDFSPWTGLYYDQFALGAVLTPARRALVLGMGGGASILALRAAAPDVEIDAVEIDPKVVYAAAHFFELPQNDPRLRIHIADARPWLQSSDRNYDIIQLDLYQGGPYVPFYLATVEFFDLTRHHLASDGVVMMNVLDPGEGARLLNTLAATLRRVYPTVVALPVERGSFMVLAFAQEQSLDSIRRRLGQATGVPEAVRKMAWNSRARLFSPRGDRSIRPFTDDLSAIEAMTRRALADFRRTHGRGG